MDLIHTKPFMILCLFCQVVVVHDVKPFLNFEPTDFMLTCTSQWCWHMRILWNGANQWNARLCKFGFNWICIGWNKIKFYFWIAKSPPMEQAWFGLVWFELNWFLSVLGLLGTIWFGNWGEQTHEASCHPSRALVHINASSVPIPKM